MPEPKDPLFDDEPQSMLARLLPPLVLICAFGGFVALAIYAYKAGTQSVSEGELMVIEADKTPVKEKPEDPGGMQFPNQDKTIFETFSANGGKEPPQVERVLPTPEEPIAKEAESTEPTTWVNEKLATATPAAPAGAEKVFGDEDAPPVAAAAPQVKNVQEELAKQAVTAPAPSVVVPEAPAAAEIAAAKPVELSPATSKETLKEEVAALKEEVKVAEKAITKPAAKPVEKPKAAKGLVQLGAYKSEAEAKGDFTKIQKKNAVLAGKSPVINRADLGDKGVFFRLRVATDDAKAMCAKLSANGQACMAVK